jgi:hypothetical protein
MSLVGLINLTERLSNQNSTESQQSEVPPKTAAVQTNPKTHGAAEDQFTPSPQNGREKNSAQEAGLFSVTRISFFSAAAEFLLGLATAPEANQPATGNAAATANTAAPQDANANAAVLPAAPTPAATTTALATLAQTVPAAANTTNPVATAATQRPVVPITNFTPAAAAPAASSTATSNLASTQQQLQALNQALAALGLSAQDIQQLDRIASIINDFNPSAFTALVNQLETLAEQAAPQAAATGANATLASNNTNAAATNPAANGTAPSNAAAVNAPAAAGTAANGGAFQIQELIIKFSGVNIQETAQTNANANAGAQNTQGNAGTSGSFLYSAFNLQIEEVNLTLVNGNGQTAQIQAPLPNATTNGAATIPAAVSQIAKAANA